MTHLLTADAENQKLRGGYHTPEPIARFLANWAVRSPNDDVLEPSCGKLLEAAVRRLLRLGASAAQVSRQARMIETLERLARRQKVADSDDMAGAISLAAWNPADGSISSRVPAQESPLRIEKFSLQVETAYVSRYKGLPPHTD